MNEMDDPRRLLTDGDAFEREVIAAGVHDGPSGRSLRKVAAAIGLGTATLGTAGVAAETTAGTAAPGVVTTGAVAFTVVKWIGVVVLGVATVGGAVQVARSGGQKSAHSSPRAGAHSGEGAAPPGASVAQRELPLSASTSVVAAAPSIAAPPDPVPRGTTSGAPSWQIAPAPIHSRPQAVTETVPPVPELEPQPPHASPATTDDTPAPAPLPRSPAQQVPVSTSSLTAETTALDEARVAVNARQPARALQALDAYDAAFPDGMLAQEAQVLRIEVSVSVGDAARAARLGRAFLLKHPESPLVPRVRSIMPPMTNP